MMARPIRVLIVDDSSTIRAMLRATIAADSRLAVVGEARDPYEARDLIKSLSPDVLTLDVEMPRMNGLDFLERLIRLRPMPVVMVSTRTSANSAVAVQALAMGAVDCVDVARLQLRPDIRARLADTLVAAAGAKVRGGAGISGPDRPDKPAPVERGFSWNGRTIVIGSSTGGVEALERLLGPFPRDCPPTLIAQHMPAGFLESFARRLDAALAPRVAIAEPGEEIAAGTVLLAGGGARHLTMSGSHPLRVSEEPSQPTDLYTPSVDRLFHSAVPHARRIVGVILTGMGRDGAEGLLALRKGGARTVGQSAETCVIDGMPRAAREIGAVEENVGLDQIGRHVLNLCERSEVVR